MNAVKEQLIRGKAWLESHKWVQGEAGDLRTCACALGALEAGSEDGYSSETFELVSDLAGGSIFRFNDTPGRTKAEVLDLYDRAIAACEDET